MASRCFRNILQIDQQLQLLCRNVKSARCCQFASSVVLVQQSSHRDQLKQLIGSYQPCNTVTRKHYDRCQITDTLYTCQFWEHVCCQANTQFTWWHLPRHQAPFRVGLFWLTDLVTHEYQTPCLDRQGIMQQIDTHVNSGAPAWALSSLCVSRKPSIQNLNRRAVG